MKPTRILWCAIAWVAMVFATGNVPAEPGYLNISGIAASDKSTPTGRALVKTAFNTKYVLTLLANGTGQLWISNSTSHLVYDPFALNAAASLWYGEPVYGIFWATNTTSHAFYRLDNADTNSAYWNYIEIDYNDYLLGFWDPFEISNGAPFGENWVTGYVRNTSRNAGQVIGSDAIFYVHDNPYDYDYVDGGGNKLFHNNGLVIRGFIAIAFNINNTSSHRTDSIAIQGAGDANLPSSEPVVTGKLMWTGRQ